MSKQISVPSGGLPAARTGMLAVFAPGIRASTVAHGRQRLIDTGGAHAFCPQLPVKAA